MRVLFIVLTFALLFSVIDHNAVEARRYSVSTKCLPPVLKKRLSEIKRKFGPIKIISTFRKNARIRRSGRRSKHASCRAVDFKVRNKRQVYRWLAKVHRGGVGIYFGRCSHIHIDNGVKYRWASKAC